MRITTITAIMTAITRHHDCGRLRLNGRQRRGSLRATGRVPRRRQPREQLLVRLQPRTDRVELVCQIAQRMHRRILVTQAGAQQLEHQLG